MYLTWPSFNNIRMLLMACMPIVIFYLIWLINTSETIRSDEGTLLNLVCWPDGNVIPVIIAFTSLAAVFIEIFGLYQLFKAGLPKREHNVTSGLFYYVILLIILIVTFLTIIFYSGLQSTIIRAKIKGGITKAMLRYSTHLPSKVAIDRLQTRFQCCGRVAYNEWFYIPWHDPKMPKEGSYNNNKFVSDDVPYSCCSRDVMWPCIHYGVLQSGDVYKYSPEHLTIWPNGCEKKLINEMTTISWKFNAVMALIIIGMVLQVIAVRYLHTAYRNGLTIDNQIVSEAYLLRSITQLSYLQVDHKKLLRNNLKEANTTRWVKHSNKNNKHTKKQVISSDSELSSSDMLKPIYE